MLFQTVTDHKLKKINLKKKTVKGLTASERAVEDGLDSEYESDQELTDWIMSLSGIKF